MITLIGQYDSGFVRRAAIALHHHGIPFARKVLSVYADFDAVRAVNPLGKAPALVLGDGRVLPDSRAIVEWLERAAPPERRLISSDPDAAFEVLQVEAVGLGLLSGIVYPVVRYLLHHYLVHDFLRSLKLTLF